MTDIEQIALDLRKRALDVLDGKAEENELVYELHRLERNDPPLFDQIVRQLEVDNERWSESSGFPVVSVQRDGAAKLERLVFVSGSKSLEWRSDHGEREWLESFAKQMIEDCEREKRRE